MWPQKVLPKLAFSHRFNDLMSSDRLTSVEHMGSRFRRYTVETMSDFISEFKNFEESVKNAAKGLIARFDHFTLKWTIDCLKSTDYEVASGAIDQLVKEKNLLAIAPLYVVTQGHPNERVKVKAEKALKVLDAGNEVEDLVKDKNMTDAVKALVERFGHYRQ